MLLATACPACGAVGPAPCPSCRAALRAPSALPPPPGIDRCLALLGYEGVGREVVARLKYRNARSAVPWLAAGMAALVAGEAVDVVTWVPTTAARRRQRGFDHGRLLARAVARRLGVPCRPLFRRLPGPPQTGASRAARLRGPRLVLRRSPPDHVLLVDDVVTTGATLAAAARALRSVPPGPARVTAVAAARRRGPCGDTVEGGEPACVH